MEGQGVANPVVGDNAGTVQDAPVPGPMAGTAGGALPPPTLAPLPVVLGAGTAAPGGETGSSSPRAPRGSTLRSHTMMGLRAIASTWRLPETPGKLPVYVQRNFRLKALGLVFVQLLVVLSIMLLVHHTDFAKSWGVALQGALFALVIILVITLTLLAALKAMYPVNYILLGLVTLLAGVVWGVSGHFLPASMHFQMVGIMCVAMFVTMVVVTLLSFVKALHRWELVLASVFSGWIAGSVVDLLIAPKFGIPPLHILISILVTLLLFLVFLFEIGRLLVHCNPDTFMSIVVAMDSTLLVIVSIPLLWAIGLSMFMSCCLQSGDEEAEAREAQEAAQEVV